MINPNKTVFMQRPQLLNSDKNDLQILLDKAGINEASLFTGIDATARHLGWKFKSRGCPR
jgi:hypothetical protein